MQAVTAHTNTNIVRTAKSVRAIENIGPCLYIRSIHIVKITISITCHGVVRADKDRVLLDEAPRSDAVEPVRPFENADVAVFDEVARVLEREKLDPSRIPVGTDGHGVGLDEAFVGGLGQSEGRADPIREDLLAV